MIDDETNTTYPPRAAPETLAGAILGNLVSFLSRGIEHGFAVESEQAKLLALPAGLGANSRR